MASVKAPAKAVCPELAAIFGDMGDCSADQNKRVQVVKDAAKAFARVIADSAPDTADRARAFQFTHEAVVNATKAILGES